MVSAPVLYTLLAVLLSSSVFFTMFWSRKNWSPAGKHCYVTGGSSGLGLALAKHLTQIGAHVSIVARDQVKLDAALKQMELLRKSPDQILKAYSHSLTTASGAQAAFDQVCDGYGKCPDVVFMCAGISTPGFLVEQTEETLIKGMDNSYWIQAWTAFAAAKRMVRDRCAGSKLIFVSSTLGFFGLLGYSTYSPGKHAVRGLAENMRSEMLLYGVDVHVFFPGTIYSPGYENENKTKPPILLKIEERDEGAKPEEYITPLIDGVSRGYFHISADFISNLFRTTTRATAPHNNPIIDTVYTIIGLIGIGDWRRSTDKRIRAHRADHEAYLEANAYFKH